MRQSEYTSKGIPNFIYLAMVLLIIGMVVASILLIRKAGTYAGEAADRAIAAAKNAYTESKEESKKKAKEDFCTKAKEQYKVEVHSDITISSVKETANLNVLECQTTDYFYRDLPEQKITACLKVTGGGKYTVNLKNAEYCIDQDRSAVYIRLPQPVFEYIGELNEESMHFNKEGIQIGPFQWGDGTTKEGSDLLDEVRAEASEKLSEELSSDPELKYMEAAKKSAQKLLTELVHAANPNIPDILVDISFVE